MGTEDEIYKEAITTIDVLVQDVLLLCEDVAAQKEYDNEWVLAMFKERFLRATKKNT